MTRHPFGGIYAATILPMTADGAIDEAALTAHLGAVLATDGIVGLLVNGHAGENAMLTVAETAEVVAVARKAAWRKLVVCGINAEGTSAAAERAACAAREGADAVMVFPPFSWALGADRRSIVAHHKAIAEAAGTPMFLFQGAVGAGKTAYTEPTLGALLEIETVVGIKEGSWETLAYDRTRRLARTLRPDVAVMASGDEHLFPSFAIGSDGSLVSLAAVVPELIVALERAVDAGDMAEGRRLHDALFELGRIVYGAPGHLATARLKACLVMLGRIPSAVCRAPAPALDAAETEALAGALRAAGLTV
ncbi:dihydrodipicolinate synthase family protein [Acuticoccus sp. MNP-M23]|uniref:dihydrodipicolinate synthase family protein n=1 Tax=Acuticoccus sp. MNP-M23 TaxID=3072793 RepID=UPI0028149B0B|nr:dihydrodipicolinate synthase family protein [Acuticoccus sp. MNP-M23]WMS42934.1 dihydrodipicolinate synthase family protein [Acuticoccus sp. MNP-M23]